MYLYNYARGSYTATIKAYQFLGTISWDESTVTWNNAGANSLGDLQASVGVSSTSSGYYAFDITDAARLWVGNLRTADYRSQQGIIFLNANESNIDYARNFRMSEFGASYTPYIIVNYSLHVDDGGYFLQNAGTLRYMDLEGPSTLEGAPIQQWDFHTGNQAKWYIKRQSDGYYSIQSVYSGKYIGVENNSMSNNAAIRQYSSNSATGTRWGFSISSSGNYILTAKSAGTYDRVLSVPLNANSNGTDLIQYTYSNDTDLRDEWKLYSLNMQYVNYYDSSFVGNSTLINNIASAVSFSNTVYEDLCGISFTMNGNATQYTNFVADDCALNVNSPCSSIFCGSACSSHHKNLVNISDQFYNLGIESNERYVIWTNRALGTYCEQKYGAHVTVPAIAAVYASRPVIHFMNIEGTANVQKACMTLNLVHETAHTFTMPDVYGDEHDLSSGYICIMEYFEASYAYAYYQDILDGTKQPFCSSCTSNIRNRALTSVVNG